MEKNIMLRRCPDSLAIFAFLPKLSIIISHMSGASDDGFSAEYKAQAILEL
jgi:hypothetical protein